MTKTPSNSAIALSKFYVSFAARGFDECLWSLDSKSPCESLPEDRERLMTLVL